MSGQEGPIRLDLRTGRLYGREQQVEQLQQAWQAVQKAPTRVVSLHGYSGSGKTTLCEHLRDDIVGAKGGWFASGKYDQNASFSEPYSAVIQSLEALGAAILAAEPDDETEERLQESLQYEAKLLTHLIPSIGKLVEKDGTGADDATATSETAAAAASGGSAERLMVAAQSFLHALLGSPMSRPLALFIDDLQWADSSSLELLSTLVSDPSLTNLLLVGAYREEEAAEEVHAFFNGLEAPVTDISVGNLDQASVNALLSDLLSTRDPDGAAALGEVVSRKTDGNPFFILQFLDMLYRRDLLQYSLVKLRWEWDMEEINSTDAADNVADILTSRLETLPANVLRVLQLGSCLGFFFEEQLLDVVLSLQWIGEKSSESKQEVEPISTVLDFAEREGLVDRSTPTLCKFSHDRVQQCLYDLFSDPETRCEVHYRIGRAIRDSLEEERLPSHFVLIAAEQMNRGAAHLSGDSERLSLLRLNLEAARAAHARGVTKASSTFCHEATKRIRESDWTTSYELVLEAMSFAAEVDYALGEADVTNQLVVEVLQHARTFDDTVRVTMIRIQLSMLALSYNEGLAVGKEALARLGERLPASNKLGFLRELVAVRKLLRNKSDKELTSLPPIADESKVSALRILNPAVFVAWASNNTTLLSIMLLRMMRITVQHGSCAETAFVFVCYGVLLAILGREDEAVRFAELGLSWQKDGETTAYVTLIVFCCLMWMRKPWVMALDPLLAGYRSSLGRTNEAVYVAGCLGVYSQVYLMCGLPLRPFLADMQSFERQLRICKQNQALQQIVHSQRLAQILLGETTDPLLESIWESEWDDPNYTVTCAYWRLFAAYVFNDSKLLKHITEQMKTFKATRCTGSHITSTFFTFVDGIVAYALLRKQGSRRQGRNGRRAAKELRRSAQRGNVNCVSLVKFLEAEALPKQTKTDELRTSYDAAISQFSRSGLTHFGAIANERAGEAMLRHGEEAWAEVYLSAAVSLYGEYNAEAKCHKLREQYAFLRSSSQLTQEESVRSSALRGRSRFSVTKDSIETKSSSSMRKLYADS